MTTPNALAALAAEVAKLREDLDLLMDEGVPGRGYQPEPSPRWWQLQGQARADAIARLRVWVERVYKVDFGQVAAKLPACWAEHPLCLVVLDILCETHGHLWLQPTRLVGHLGGQAELVTRVLPIAADLMQAESYGCPHKSVRAAP